MANYLRNRATAERLIRQNGTKSQMKKPGSIDKITGKPNGVDTEQNIFVVFLMPGTSGDAQLDQFRGDDGSLDLLRLKKVLVSTEGLQWEPDSTCLIKYEGEWWKYYGVSVLDPDGKTKIFYKGYIQRV